ncbi:hypothetical protein ACJROX_05805 [Pseudalkalibacillus sp. A8]|uniref:hypothetical protein n=1 Tax=Pseudalkalibacillus sp. A8 TaxID=3382641 RepID=UPI0038B440D7
MSCGCNKKDCKGCVCDQFKKLRVGDVIQITLGDDEFFEDQDYIFTCFDHKDCCVTLIDASDDNPFIVDCQRIRGIKFITNTTLVNG